MACSIKNLFILTTQVAFPGYDSIQFMTQVFFPGIDSFQLMTQVASEKIDSNQVMIQAEATGCESTHESTLSRIQIAELWNCRAVECRIEE